MSEVTYTVLGEHRTTPFYGHHGIIRYREYSIDKFTDPYELTLQDGYVHKTEQCIPKTVYKTRSVFLRKWYTLWLKETEEIITSKVEEFIQADILEVGDKTYITKIYEKLP